MHNKTYSITKIDNPYRRWQVMLKGYFCMYIVYHWLEAWWKGNPMAQLAFTWQVSWVQLMPLKSRTCTHNLLVQLIDHSENGKAVDAPRNSSVQKQTSTSSNCCESSRFVSAATRSEYLYNIDQIALRSLCSADFLTNMSSSLKESLGHQQKYVNHTINPKELKYVKKTCLWDCREISTTTFWR